MELETAVFAKHPQWYSGGMIGIDKRGLPYHAPDRPTATINLDDLESDAVGSPVAGCVAECPSRMPPHSCAAVTLALIARIRELEQAVQGTSDFYAPRTSYGLMKLLEKGAVLP